MSGIFVVLFLEDFAGDFPGGFFWALFPTKMRRKNPARNSAKNPAAQKIKSAKNPFCQKPTLKMLLFQIKFPDFVTIFYITELVLNYFLGYVISCIDTKHIMLSVDCNT